MDDEVKIVRVIAGAFVVSLCLGMFAGVQCNRQANETQRECIKAGKPATECMMLGKI